MKGLLLLLIALAVGTFDAFALFIAWFTIGFFGASLVTIAAAIIAVAVAVAATIYGYSAWRRVRCGEFAI